MKNKKMLSTAAVGILSMSLLAGCGSNTAEGGSEGGSGAENFSLRLAHNQPEIHPVHTSLEEFATVAEEATEGSVEVEVFPNGQLGQEREVIELVQSGTLDMAKVSASALEGFDSNYAIFSLPYVFQSREHFHEVMDNSEAVQEIFTGTADEGFVGIGWYDAGQRSIYTIDKKVETPADLNGMKIRVQESPTSIAMIEAMGGSPTPMAYGEIFTSLQSGVIDGAENNEASVSSSGHGEVAKAYSYTEHQYVPDVLIVNAGVWDEMSDEQKLALEEAADVSSESHKDLWQEAIEGYIEEAKGLGVEFYEIDKTPFIEAATPLHEEYKAANETNAGYFEDFQSYLN